MKKTLLGLLAICAAALGSASVARAQSTGAAIVTVPFRFVVSGKMLPAGSYRIAAQSQDSLLLMITSLDGRGPAVFVGTERAPNVTAPGSRPVRVLFQSYGGQHFLSEVAVAGEDARRIPLRRSAMDQALARLNLLPPERADGVSK